MSHIDQTPDHGSQVDVLNVNYFLEVGDAEHIASFYRLEGGDASVNYIKHSVAYKTGEAATWLIPTTTRFEPVVLARGFGNSAYLYNWFALAAQGRIFEARRHCSIRVMANINGSFEAVTYFHLYDAWISKIEGFSTNQYNWAGAAELVVTIVPEYIQRVDEPIEPSRKARGRLAYELSAKVQTAVTPTIQSAAEKLKQAIT